VMPFVVLLLFSRLTQLTTTEFALHLGISLLRITVAYLISVTLAWLCAMAFYRGRRALVALPIFDVLQSFPTFAALPLAVHVFGASNTVVIFFLVIAMIWPLFFATISSLKLAKREWEEAVTISRLQGV